MLTKQIAAIALCAYSHLLSMSIYLFVMAGDSGTSFKTSPESGKCLAEWITEGQPRTADLRPFRASRFVEDNPWGDVATYGRVQRTVSR